MTRRTVLAVAALALTLAAAGWLFAPHFDDARFLRPIDYMEYWSAGRATLNGQNPYDGGVLYPMQLDIQKHHPEPFGDPIMMWNPPWTLPLAMPLGLAHWRVGQLAWFTLNAVGFLLAARLLWRVYGGPAAKPWVPVAVAFAFGPTVFQLMLLNVTGFVYLGLVGFVYLLQKPTALFPPPPLRGRSSSPEDSAGGGLNEEPPTRLAPLADLPLKGGGVYVAGCLAALTAIKPHLFVPFAVVLALETLRGQRVWRATVAGGLMLVVFALLPLLWNPDVWAQYRAATAEESSSTHYTTRDWNHPTLGHQLREALPGRPFYALFLPLAVGVPLVAAYWWARRHTWNWTDELPRLILASLILTPYGAWGCDLVVLTIPVLQATAWLTNDRRKHLWAAFGTAFLALNALAYLRLQDAGSMGNPWITPAVAVGYVLAGWVTRTGNAVTGWGEQLTPSLRSGFQQSEGNQA